MLTSRDDVKCIEDAYDAGATDVLTKPINRPILGHRVRYVVRASEALRELAESQTRLAKSQRVARLGSWQRDACGGLIHGSDEIHAIAGLPPAYLPRRLPEVLEFVHAADRERVRDSAASWLVAEGTHSTEFRLRRPDGATRSVLRQVEGEFDEKGRIVCPHGIVQDVTDRKRAEERIHRLEHYGTLSDLPNRAWLLERLEQSIARARRREEPIAVLFLDLDQFRRINDTLGHSAADEPSTRGRSR